MAPRMQPCDRHLHREMSVSRLECLLPRPIRGSEDTFSGAICSNATALLPSEAMRMCWHTFVRNHAGIFCNYLSYYKQYHTDEALAGRRVDRADRGDCI
jgi:hypothetical protein